uniref:Uncharacterized protein n=1 Tax=Anguilla anguilla TaxID=7936 RepID=A0A0E9VZH5_ANGAN
MPSQPGFSNPFNWQRKASVIPAEGTQGSVFTPTSFITVNRIL